jgi:hypothetical protein
MGAFLFRDEATVLLARRIGHEPDRTDCVLGANTSDGSVDKEVPMHRLPVVLSIVALALLAAAPTASADPQPNPSAPIQSCFGIVSGQLASSEPGVTGEHVSSQSEPRIGLGNVVFRGALGVTFTSVGEAGSFLATIDNNAATFCPAP